MRHGTLVSVLLAFACLALAAAVSGHCFIKHYAITTIPFIAVFFVPVLSILWHPRQRAS